MIPDYIIREIQQRLAGDRPSIRQIAQALGLDPATVRAVARGQLVPKQGELGLDGASQPDDQLFPGVAQPLDPPRRCPTSGGLVYLPSRLCRVRRVQRARPPRPTAPACAPRSNCRDTNERRDS
ncbi:MAG: hypothetical protein AB7O62_10605 [Pirellulales bacterium]